MIRRAVAAEPNDAAYRDSLGWVLFRLGHLDEAWTELRKAVAAEKPEPEVLEHLADVLAAAKKPAEARETWTRRLKGYQNDRDDEKAHAIQEKLDRLKSK